MLNKFISLTLCECLELLIPDVFSQAKIVH